MSDDAPAVDERAARRQMKRFLFAVVGSFVVGLLLITRAHQLLVVPFLLGWYGLYRWLQDPLPDDAGDGAREPRGSCIDCGESIPVGTDRCEACADVTGGFRK